MAGGETQAAGGYLVASMWWYAANVLEPTRALKRAGMADHVRS